jgi:hypothetical protein
VEPPRRAIDFVRGDDGTMLMLKHGSFALRPSQRPEG